MNIIVNIYTLFPKANKIFSFITLEIVTKSKSFLYECISFLTLDADTTEENRNSDKVEETDNGSERASGDRIVSAEQLFILECSYQTTYEHGVQISDKTNSNNIEAKACQHSGNVFSTTIEYKKAIECYQKASEASLDFEDEEVTAFQWLGYNHVQAGQYQGSKEVSNMEMGKNMKVICTSKSNS